MSLTPGQVLEALNNKADIDVQNLDTLGKITASVFCMPSTQYINLTLGASGSTYTAPANGYFVLYISAINPAGYIYMENLSSSFKCETRSTINGTGVWAFCPAKKSEKVLVGYDALGTVSFKFHYAEGSKQEAN